MHTYNNQHWLITKLIDQQILMTKLDSSCHGFGGRRPYTPYEANLYSGLTFTYFFLLFDEDEQCQWSSGTHRPQARWSTRCSFRTVTKKRMGASYPTYPPFRMIQRLKIYLKPILLLASTDRLFPKMGECREVLGGGPAPPSKL